MTSLAVDPGDEYDLAAVRVLERDAAVVLPVVDLRNRTDSGGGEPRHNVIPSGSVWQIEHQIIAARRRRRPVPQSDDLEMNPAAGQA
jgi:hypothetical protein